MSAPTMFGDSVFLYAGDCTEVMRSFPDGSLDAIVTDPPYGLGFMGKEWDDLPPGLPWAQECLRVLKPGGHLLAFGGTRTWHRLAVAVEDAGFEVRDSIAWLYGSGFPKSLDASKAIEAHLTTGGSASRNLRRVEQDGGGEPYTLTGKNNGIVGETRVYERKEFTPATDAAKTWQGWGTALKPAFEPIVVARKPLVGTVAANVLAHGTGALNIDACRVGTEGGTAGATAGPQGEVYGDGLNGAFGKPVPGLGRWPANVVLDDDTATELGDVSRFFYCAKAPTSERPKVDGVAHPTVKPLALMRWLLKLVTPPGGVVLDPFAGSGTTLEAAVLEDIRIVGIERDATYLPLIEARMARNGLTAPTLEQEQAA